MRLPKYPVGQFDTGPSGRRFSASDMPMLRSMREVYAGFIQRSREIDWAAEGPGMVLAASMVVADMEARRDAAGRVLDMLERTPAGWRP